MGRFWGVILLSFMSLKVCGAQEKSVHPAVEKFFQTQKALYQALEEDFTFLRDEIRGEWEKIPQKQREKALRNFKEQVIKALEEDRKKFEEIRNLLTEVGGAPLDNFPFYTSLNKMIGTIEEKGLLDRSVDLIHKSPQILLGDFSYFPKKNPTAHEIAVTKNILLYSLVLVKKAKNLDDLVLAAKKESLKALYPVVMTPPKETEVDEDAWKVIEEKLPSLTLYGRTRNTLSDEMVGVLFIPNGGYVFGGGLYRGQDREEYGFKPAPLGDCSSLLSYILDFSPHKTWVRFSTLQLEWVYDILQGREVDQEAYSWENWHTTEELTEDYEAVTVTSVKDLKPGDLIVSRTYQFKGEEPQIKGRGHVVMVIKQDPQSKTSFMAGDLNRDWNKGMEGICVSSQEFIPSSKDDEKPYIRTFVLRKKEKTA